MTTFYFNSSGNLGSYALPEHWQFANIIATTAITLNTKLEHLVKNAQTVDKMVLGLLSWHHFSLFAAIVRPK